ncbi:MAG: copper chaperone PCu(A)C [Burkholderiaceae bacterium]|nr:MAG: copper chaperone PCu(A)C [Burkholderiaceae bacterium]
MTYPHRSPSARAVAGRAFFSCLMLAGVLAGAVPAQAQEEGVLVSGPWMRFIMPSRPAAGYFTLSNHTAQPRTLVGADSPACGRLMLHRSLTSNGVDRMTMMQDIDVPAHGKVVFSPGGYHLMCVSPSAAMIPGHSVPVTLHFKDGGAVMASFPVRGVTGK